MGSKDAHAYFQISTRTIRAKLGNAKYMLQANYVYLSDGIKFIQQNLIELSLADTIPEIENGLIYRESRSEEKKKLMQ